MRRVVVPDGSGGRHEAHGRAHGRLTTRLASYLPRWPDLVRNDIDSSRLMVVRRGRPTMTRVYLHPARLADLADRLDDRDRSILDDLSRVRLATALQLQRLHHGPGDNEAARYRRLRQLKRLTRLGMTTPLQRRVGGTDGGSVSTVYALGLAGQRLCAPGVDVRARRPSTPGTPFVTHTLTITELYVRLREAEAAGRLELIGFEAEPTAWRPFHDHGGRAVMLKPDAYAVVGTGEFEQHAFVEVDLGTTSPKRLTLKGQRYLDYSSTRLEQRRLGVFPAVIWVAPDEARASVIAQALRPLGDFCFEIVQLDDFVAAVEDER